MTTIAEIKAKGTITVNDNISFKLEVDVLNEIFNCGYKEFQKASWFPEGKNKGKRFVWFPKFSFANGQPVAVEWDNYFFNADQNYICERRMLTEAASSPICKGNPSHYNNPLNYIKSGEPVPALDIGRCQFIDFDFEWHSKTKAAFGKINDEVYKFFGIYEFIGVQIADYEKINRYGNNSHLNVKDKYINVIKRTQTELKISDWT